MKCIYCEANETRGVLLCYSCQVDLFPLISSWAYCGVCGNELPDDNMICPQCAEAEASPKPMGEALRPLPAIVSSSPEGQPGEPLRPCNSTASVATSSKLKPLPKEPPVTREEIRQARRLQLVIRSVFVIFWLVIVILVLLWARDFANRPIPTIVP